jgi:predicted nucleic acid-binding protein
VKTGADFDAFVARHARIGLDTSAFIYHLDGDAMYAPLTSRLFNAVEQRQSSAVTSTISMLELLVRPLRDDNVELVNAIYAIGARYPNLTWLAVTLPIAERAATLRARHRLHTPDAIQIASALEAGCGGFVTNDRMLSRVIDLEVFILDDAVR